MRYRRPRQSVVLAAVAAVAVASPLVVLAGGAAPTNTVEDRAQPARATTTIDEVSLDQVPSLVLNLVTSGLSRAGVTLPPIDASKVTLPDLPVDLPPGLASLLPAPSAAATTSRLSTPAPTSPASSTPSASSTPADAPAGAVVKEIKRDTPFSMVGLTWDGLSDTTPYIRAKKPNGDWGPWYAADPEDAGVRKSPTDPLRQGSEPIWVGDTTWVQVAVTRKGVAVPGEPGTAPSPSVGATTTSEVPRSGASRSAVPRRSSPTTTAPQRGSTTRPSAAGVAPSRTPSSPQPNVLPTSTVASGQVVPRAFTEKLQPPAPSTSGAAAPQSSTPQTSTPGSGGSDLRDTLQQTISTLKAALISTGKSGDLSGTGGTSSGGRAAVPGAMPTVISRAQWGADESERCSQPTYDDTLKGAVVHHTAGNNDYTAEQSADIVRSIYAYHAQTLGWCDIGYNALVDKFGQIFEGAYGGLDKNVEGTHTGGFNKNTVGVAMLGDLNDVAPTTAMINSVGNFLGWRLRQAGLDPGGQAQLTSEGFESSRYSAGQVSALPVISGHRDYDDTECPGNLGYAALPQIRSVAETGTQVSAPSTDTSTSSSPVPGTGAPVTSATGTTQSTDSAIGRLGALAANALAPDVLSQADTGAIAQKWRSVGGATGLLGKPTSAELTTTDGKAKFADFANGQVVWSPETGAQILQGAIKTAWSALGGSGSPLGLPTGTEITGNDNISQVFQFGTLVFNTVTGGVMKVIKTYQDTYAQHQGGSAAVPSAAPAG
ncbi:N-acetylmuramoyl-L-alanine amidase [Williamsia sterculiae]|uniref:Uncharacterized conserved protein, contains LGFP repeats n=1 Tax=Williamsia sterculiae TaxID=1344003 RepID=A0A1N7H938_9NOCA|nr:N-acetylmuramoyl-L-alanine amidase [Williamsia sterculiae]SIS21210.1 Uncharacterized conserved protein, contains LGFP repeats [Williamsia sterculiae]